MSKDVFHIMFTLIRNQSVLVGGGASGEIQSLSLTLSLSLCHSPSLSLSFWWGGPLAKYNLSVSLSLSLSLSMPDIIIQLVLVFHARWRAATASFPYFPPAGARICWQ